MVDERVVEAVFHSGSKFLAVVLVQRKNGNNFLQQHLVHVAQDGFVVHAVTHNVEACQVSTQNKTGVCAVQDADLALLIRAHIGGNKDVVFQTSLAERQDIVQLGVALNDPHAENLANVQQGVSVTVLLFKLGNFLRVADATRNNAVNQRAAEGTVLVDIFLEAVFQAPLVNVLVDALQQLLAVVVNQLAGQHDDALLAGLVAVVQHLGQLCGEAGRRAVVLLAGGIINDTGLGGVGNDDFQVVAGGNVHHLFVISFFIRVQAAGYTGDHALVIDLLAVFAAAQVQGVQALLFVDHLGQAGGDGLNQNALAVPVSFFVGKVKPVVNKGTQEVALTKLQNLFGGIFQNVAIITGFFKDLIIQSFHWKFSFAMCAITAAVCRARQKRPALRKRLV